MSAVARARPRRAPSLTRAVPTRRELADRVPELMPYVYVLALGATIYALKPDLLFGSGALDARASIVVPLALVAFGQSLALFTRGVDLSLGGAISLVSALLVTKLHGTGAATWAAVAAVLALGVLLGSINGSIVGWFRIEPFIITLGTWSIFGGVALWVLPVEGGSPSPQLMSALFGSILGVPKSILVLALLFCLWAWMRRTRFIQDVYAIGSDVARAHLTGVPVTRRLIQVYALSGLFAAAAAVWLVVQNASGSPVVGNQYILSSIAAVVLGGTSIFGGSGSVASALVGAIAFLMIPDLVFALDLESFWGVFLQGFILVVAVAANSAIRKRASA